MQLGLGVGLFACFKSQIAIKNYKVKFNGTTKLNFSVSLSHAQPVQLRMLSSFTSPFCYIVNAVSSVPLS